MYVYCFKRKIALSFRSRLSYQQDKVHNVFFCSDINENHVNNIFEPHSVTT